jgi:hypothetical protein
MKPPEIYLYFYQECLIISLPCMVSEVRKRTQCLQEKTPIAAADSQENRRSPTFADIREIVRIFQFFLVSIVSP